MKYRWKALFERSKKVPTSSGSINTYEQEEIQGKLEDCHSGSEALAGVLESTKDVGNIIHLELERVE